MRQGAYAEAIKPLKRDFFGKDQNITAGVLLAKCYYQLRDYQEAADVMARISPHKLTDPNDRRFAADVHIANEHYSDAYLEIIELLSTDQSDAKTYLWLDKISDLLDWDSLPNGSKAETVKGINSVYNDYAPYVAENGELWFVSDVAGIQTIFPASYDNRNIHLYYKTKPKGKDPAEVKKPSMLLKSRDYYYHDGPITEWKTENKYVLTLRDIDVVNGRVGLYFSNTSGKGASLVPFKYNGDYNTGHASFTNDGTRMIFSSDRDGGYGQMDLWYSDWVDGDWTEPVNFGPVINTPFNEVFPVYNSGKIYYSSDRTDKGYGALDIYYTIKSHGFNEVYNLRSPINGPYDDFAITFIDANEGYFASNRKPGVGGDDIYTFKTVPIKIKVKESHFEFANATIPKDAKLDIYNAHDSLVASVSNVENNTFKVANLESAERYILKSENAHIPKEASLKLVSKNGNDMATYTQAANKTYDFEIIPPADWIEPKGDSKPGITIKETLSGKIIAAEGVITEGIPVALKTSDGVVLSKSKTTSDGRFTMKNVALGEKYTIETENMDDYHEIDIFGKSGAITQSIVPTGKNRFSYTRAPAPAMWMETQEVSIPNVFAIVPNLNQGSDEPIVMYDGEDNELTTPEIDSDGFMKLGTMHTGKAYRLNLPDRDLHRDDRLVIIGGSGDTSQTVRPFDANNYFFEYLIYKDYGQAESDPETEPAIIALNPDSKLKSYKAQILNFDLPETTPFILRSTDGEQVDTLYADSKGVMIMSHINEDLEYELELIYTTFARNKEVEVYDSDSKLVYMGISENRKTFIFESLNLDDYSLAKQKNKDLSVLKLDFTGRVTGQLTKPVAITVRNADGMTLGSAYSTLKGDFSIKDIEAASPFVVTADTQDPDAALLVKIPNISDSLRITRSNDGNFYVNVTDPKQAESPIIALNSNQKETSFTGQILNFDLPETTPFVLRSMDGERADTLYANGQGVMIMHRINKDLEYELELIYTTFARNTKIKMYDLDNNLVCTGITENRKTFIFEDLDLDDYALSKKKNEDLSVLKLNFIGRVTSQDTRPIKIIVRDAKGLTLGSAYSTRKGDFSVKDIKPRSSYVVTADTKDPNAVLVVKVPDSPDSLSVKRNKDGKFYVNLSDKKQKEITLVDGNKDKISVKEGSRFSLPNVYYGFNSYYLKLESRKSVDRLIKLLKDNPELRVEIQSHTDSRGPANYNNLLSQRRADAVVKHITDAGINESRLIAMGKGEYELTNKCTDGVSCTDGEHAANRRTEFIILGKK